MRLQPLHSPCPSSSRSDTQHLPSGIPAGFLLPLCRWRSCSTARAVSCSKPSTYSSEGAEHPPPEGSHLPAASRTPQAPAALSAAPWHEASGLGSAEAVETESGLFTGKQFSLVLSHVQLQHAGLRATPGGGQEGGQETEACCVLPARLEQFDVGDS